MISRSTWYLVPAIVLLTTMIKSSTTFRKFKSPPAQLSGRAFEFPRSLDKARGYAERRITG